MTSPLNGGDGKRVEDRSFFGKRTETGWTRQDVS